MVAWALTIIVIAICLFSAGSVLDDHRAAAKELAGLDGEARTPYMGKSDPAAGKVLFAEHCVTCHGMDGMGKIRTAPNIGNPTFLAMASDKFLKKTVNKGRPGTTMVGRPDFTDEQLTHLIAYLRSHATDDVPDISMEETVTVTGDPVAGKDQFARLCAACHGPNGEGYAVGVPGTGIGLPGFLNAAGDDYILKTLAHGRPGTPMLPFFGEEALADLSEQDAADIIAFLRSNSATALASANRGQWNSDSDAAPTPEQIAVGEGLFKTKTCLACHGKDAKSPIMPNYPRIAGLHEEYIVRQMTDIKGGVRSNGMTMAMKGVMHLVKVEEIAKIAPYVSSLPLSVDSEEAPAGDASSPGATLYQKHSCFTCHGDDGKSPVLPTHPRITGQNKEYVLQQLNDFKSGARSNGQAVAMKGFLSLVSDDELELLADYVASLDY